MSFDGRFHSNVDIGIIVSIINILKDKVRPVVYIIYGLPTVW